ncbi:MAG: hypothetical protein AB1595_02230 [bacterium]
MQKQGNACGEKKAVSGSLKGIKLLKIDGAYALSSYRGSIAEEPCVGNPQARFCEGHKITYRRL